MNLVSTNELMRVLSVRSYTTIKKLENKGVISPVKIGRVRKWNPEECLKSVILNGQSHDAKKNV
jgi:hypothetical protein